MDKISLLKEVVKLSIGQKVRVGNSPWTETNGHEGIIKSIITTNNVGKVYLIRFNDKKINQLSKEVGGFTFERKHFKFI